MSYITAAAIHLTRLSLKDTLSNPPVILEGTPHRKCHIEDPQTALSQTKAKHCLFIVLDCFVPRNDARVRVLFFNDSTIALTVKKHCFHSLDPRFVALLRPRMTGEKKGTPQRCELNHKISPFKKVKGSISAALKFLPLKAEI
jgi:hypothetical protein